jgi:uncharacterized protein (TIGR02246 family)
MSRFKRMGLLACASAAVILLALVVWPPAAGAEDCVSVKEDAIKQLFVNWNNALQTPQQDWKHPDPREVVKLYADNAVLLPTVEIGPYTNHTDIGKYFEHFLQKKPSGKIDESKRTIRIGCNVAFDAGLYTFTYGAGGDPTKARYTYVYRYERGAWLIAHHHSSADPPPPPPQPRK